MPIYCYRCLDCGEEIETIQKIAEKKKPNCPNDPTHELEKFLGGSVSFRFKGTGFYATDYASKNKQQ